MENEVRQIAEGDWEDPFEGEDWFVTGPPGLRRWLEAHRTPLWFWQPEDLRDEDSQN